MKKLPILILLLSITLGANAQIMPHWLQIQGKPVTTPEQFGAVGDGSTDDGAKLQLWLNDLVSNGHAGLLPPNTYVSDQQLLATGDFTIVGASRENSKIKFSTAGTSNYFNIEPSTATVVLPALFVDINKDSREVTFVGAHSLSTGSVFTVLNTIDYSFQGAKASYREGEILEVESVDSAIKVTVTTYPRFDYTVAATLVCTELPTLTGSISNVTIEGGGITKDNGVVRLMRGKNFSFTNVNIIGDEYYALTVESSLNTTITGSNILQESPDTGLNYALALSNSRGVIVDNCILKGGRKGIDAGGNDNDIAVANTDISISDSHLSSFHRVGLGAHGNILGMRVTNCTIYGIEMAGDDTAIIGCDIFPTNIDSGPIVIVTDELAGLSHKLLNNTFYPSTNDGLKPGSKAIGGTITDNTTRGGILNISGNTYEVTPDPTVTSPGYVIDISLASLPAVEYSLIIEDNVFAGDFTKTIQLLGTSTAMLSIPQPRFVSISNNKLYTGLTGIDYRWRAPFLGKFSGNQISYSSGVGINIQPTVNDTSIAAVQINDNQITGYQATGTAHAIYSTYMSDARVTVDGNSIDWVGSGITITDIKSLKLYSNSITGSVIPVGSYSYFLDNIATLTADLNTYDSGAIATSSITTEYGDFSPQ